LHDNLRVEAQAITYQTENARLCEELKLLEMKEKDVEEKWKGREEELVRKEVEVGKLKREVIEIRREC
jgi:hypothetical protein